VKFPTGKDGETSFLHHEAHDLITCDMQASMLEQQQVPLQVTYLEHQVPLQDIHHVHSNLEDLSFQHFEEVIFLGNGSDLPMKPCLPVITRFLLAHHENLFSKASKGNYAELFPEKVIGNNGKQESCALTVAGAITRLCASRKLIPMAIKIFASVSHVYSFGKHMSVDATDGEQFSAVFGYHKLAEHTVLASLQFDPGGCLPLKRICF